MEYLIDRFFNEEFTMQYNSTVGNWTGFTPAGLILTLTFNKEDLGGRMVERQLICVDHADWVLSATEENMGE